METSLVLNKAYFEGNPIVYWDKLCSTGITSYMGYVIWHSNPKTGETFLMGFWEEYKTKSGSHVVLTVERS